MAWLGGYGDGNGWNHENLFLILIKEIKSTVLLEKVEKNRYTYQTQNSIFSHLKIYHLKYGIKHIFSIMSTKYVFSQHFFTYSFHNILNNNT